jgi:DNA-binding transcriptional regulator/RsmH inhibitor MraZ
VVVAGVFSRIEIWDSARWRERERQGDAALTGAEDLNDFGI